MTGMELFIMVVYVVSGIWLFHQLFCIIYVDFSGAILKEVMSGLVFMAICINCWWVADSFLTITALIGLAKKRYGLSVISVMLIVITTALSRFNV